MKNTYSLADLISVARLHHEKDELGHLVGFLPEFVELLSVKFCHDLMKQNEEKSHELAFLNFWKIQWRYDEKLDNDFSHMKSTFLATSAARKLTKKFNDAGGTVTTELEDYFHQILTRPPTYLPLLQTITGIAQKNGELYPKEMRAGTNIAYLFKILFSTVLVLTFDKDGIVSLPGIGEFERTFKIKPRQTSKDTEGGVLQFSPDTASL